MDLLRVKAVAIPEGKITGASIDEQYELADLVRNWTDKKKDWRMFTAIDDDDKEIRTNMLLLVVRGHGSIFCSMMYLDVFASRSYTVDECDCL